MIIGEIAAALVGTFLGMRSVADHMASRGGGSIVNSSSIEGLGGMPLLVAYTASKFAIRGMTKSAAMELGPKGIRVNSVHPGPIATPMTAGLSTELVASQRIPRYGLPEEVTAAVMASPFAHLLEQE